MFVKAPDMWGNMTTHLYVDNQGHVPVNTFIQDPKQDSCKAHIIDDDDLQLGGFDFDHVTLTGGAHLVAVDSSIDPSHINIGTLHGDLTGFLHVLKGPSMSVYDSNSPFPAGFRVYTDARLTLPEGG